MNSKKNYKQYFTPIELSDFLVRSVEEVSAKNIIDLSVGEGNLLNAASCRWPEANLFGVDIDESIYAKLNKNMNKKISFINEDALNIPFKQGYLEYFKVIENGGFDLCLANPPFGRIKIKDALNKSQYYPLELLFLKKYLEICKIGGTIAIIIPNGVLTNSNYLDFRLYMVENTRILKIISLSENHFANATIKAEILIIQRTMYKEVTNHPIIFEKYNLNLKLESTYLKTLDNEQIKIRLDYEFHSPPGRDECSMSRLKTVNLESLLSSHGRGATEYGEQRYFTESGVRYIHTTNMGEAVIDFDRDERYVDKNSKMYKLCAVLNIHDLIMVRVGKNVGKTCIIHSEKDLGVASDCIYIFRFKEVDMAYYFNILMETEFMRNQIEKIKYGSCSKLISKKDVLNLQVPLIPSKYTRQIALEVKDVLNDYSLNRIDKELYLINLGLIISKIENMIRGVFNEKISC